MTALESAARREVMRKEWFISKSTAASIQELVGLGVL
jgi:hypothetical protein